MAARTRVQVFGEQALELAWRQAYVGGDLLHVARLVGRAFHQADRGDQFLVGNA